MSVRDILLLHIIAYCSVCVCVKHNRYKYIANVLQIHCDLVPVMELWLSVGEY